MSDETPSPGWFSAFTRLELLVVVLIIAILLAILLPSVKWGGSGWFEVPLRVLVFDAEAGTPIPFAEVYLFDAWAVTDSNTMREHAEVFRSSIESLRARGEVLITDSDGLVTVPLSYMTEANSGHPESYLWSPPLWVYVRAPGYGASVTPLWYDRQLVKPLRSAREMRASIGLIRGD